MEKAVEGIDPSTAFLRSTPGDQVFARGMDLNHRQKDYF
jgi:hypothetical protein